jgi:signal transduction histidine kinase
MLSRLRISNKLTLGFGMLVVLTLLVAGFGLFASSNASVTINHTTDHRVPAALAASRAQTHLLMMLGAVRNYLILGDDRFISDYTSADQLFQNDLEQLDALTPGLTDENQQVLEQLQSAYQDWTHYPYTLFALRDDRMQSEPALRWLNTTGLEASSTILMKLDKMIDIQATRDSTPLNTRMMRDMARFQSSFASMLAGLRSYVMTRDANFRYYEYEVNLNINTEAWNQILAHRTLLTLEQQDLIDSVANHRTTFIRGIPSNVFEVIESERWREDLYLFRTEVEPLTEQMQQHLLHLTNSQQEALLHDMNQGRQTLTLSQWQTMIGGITAVLIGIILAFVLGQSIVRPIRRLTAVAEQIQAGDISVEATVESEDELGMFARTFNRMTGRLSAMIHEREQLMAARTDAVRSVIHDLNHTVHILFAAIDLFTMDMEDAGVPAALMHPGRQRLLSALEQQRTLLRDMRDAVLLETGTLVLQPQPTDIRTMVEQVVDMILPRYQQAGCSCTIEAGHTLPLAWCDPDRIRRVIFNVLDNAFRYTSFYHADAETMGYIHIQLTQQQNTLVCVVQDNGCGIAPEKLEQLGQKFYRLAHGERDPEGMGLGLNFCTGVLLLSNGALEITSPGPGMGTTATIRLPIAQQASISNHQEKQTYGTQRESRLST